MNYRRRYNLSHWNMLIVDDEPSNLQLHSDLLAEHRIHVFVAGSGTEALALLPRLPPLAAILLDLKMSGMSGWEVQMNLRDRSEFDEVPVIAVTALAMEADRVRAFEAGFDGYITKPFYPNPLIADVLMWMAKFQEANLARRP